MGLMCEVRFLKNMVINLELFVFCPNDVRSGFRCFGKPLVTLGVSCRNSRHQCGAK